MCYIGIVLCVLGGHLGGTVGGGRHVVGRIGVLLADELGVHPAAGNVVLCMGVCIVEEREAVLRCIALSDEARVELLRFLVASARFVQSW